MPSRKVYAAIVAAMLMAGAANAQVPRGMGPLSDGQKDLQQNGGTLSSKRYENGVAALQAGNFQVAEGIFTEILLRTPSHPEANLAQGIVKMSLGKWPEAKTVLEVAAKKMPKNPDPKGRLGVTLIKLGDREGGLAQRAELQKLADKCKGKCRDAQYITEGMLLIDQAIATTPAAPAPAP